MDELRRNIELKARCGDLGLARQRAELAGGRFVGVLEQCDTYFLCSHGRLKLRETGGKAAELVWYARGDSVEIRGSDYRLVRVEDAAGLIAALGSAMGVRGRVKKRRELWMYENVRIHLDAVEGLGDFLEFEAVLGPGETEEAGLEKVERLKRALGIAQADLIGVSYSDLMGI